MESINIRPDSPALLYPDFVSYEVSVIVSISTMRKVDRATLRRVWDPVTVEVERESFIWPDRLETD